MTLYEKYLQRAREAFARREFIRNPALSESLRQYNAALNRLCDEGRRRGQGEPRTLKPWEVP